MQFKKTYLEELGATIELTAFAPEGKTAEWHAMLHVEPRTETFLLQYRRIRLAEAHLLGMEDMKGAKPVFKRYFLSDATNQQPVMEEENVSRMFREKFPDIPTVFTLAPVCRPAWLIEMECIAIKSAENNNFKDF